MSCERDLMVADRAYRIIAGRLLRAGGDTFRVSWSQAQQHGQRPGLTDVDLLLLPAEGLQSLRNDLRGRYFFYGSVGDRWCIDHRRNTLDYANAIGFHLPSEGFDKRPQARLRSGINRGSRRRRESV